MTATIDVPVQSYRLLGCVRRVVYFGYRSVYLPKAPDFQMKKTLVLFVLFSSCAPTAFAEGLTTLLIRHLQNRQLAEAMLAEDAARRQEQAQAARDENEFRARLLELREMEVMLQAREQAYQMRQRQELGTEGLRSIPEPFNAAPSIITTQFDADDSTADNGKTYLPSESASAPEAVVKKKQLPTTQRPTQRRTASNRSDARR